MTDKKTGGGESPRRFYFYAEGRFGFGRRTGIQKGDSKKVTGATDRLQLTNNKRYLVLGLVGAPFKVRQLV
ncbi:MAG: hypothetical protein CVV21_07485 [Candidatus Goldiibacteriota bacterium HGW-Goldbacteria-1]|nr:MAG: hypothetical protein CVV21_07485 [Candidatus Goldiibacteriota bacterium HGW-Goldbacteria-1]